MANMRFLGKPHMEGWVDPDSPEGWKPLCMMAYLCVNLPLRLHTDTELAELLWPRLPLARGQRRADETARFLNSLHEEAVIECTRYGEYRVIQPSLSVDVWIFRGGVRMQRYDDALTLYRGELLANVDVPDAPEFMAWLGRQRTKYKRLASLCAWRSHQRAASNDQPHLAAGLAVLAHHHSPDPASLVTRVMVSLRSAGADEDALRIFKEMSSPSEEAVRLARTMGPAAPPEPRQRRRRVPAVVVGAVLLLAAVLAVPRVLSDREPVDVSDRASAPAPAGGPARTEPHGRPTSPSPEAIWELANRQMNAGSYDEARALFRLLLGHPRFGEAATTKSLLAWSASREGSALPGAGSAEGENASRASLALAVLRQGELDRAKALLPPPGPGTRGLSWLARIYIATYTRDPRLVEWVEAAPDTVFRPTEGHLSKHQFLGWIHDAAGDSTTADAEFQQAEREARATLVGRPDHAWSQLALARALTSRGDTAGARAALEAAAGSGGAQTALLRFKAMEVRALLAPAGSASRTTLTDSLLQARYPWSLDSLQLATDPRWHSP